MSKINTFDMKDDTTRGHKRPRGHKSQNHHYSSVIPDSVEIQIGSDDKGGLFGGWLWEVISDIPDNANTIHYSDSHLSTGAIILTSLFTLGFIIYKLFKKLLRKKKRFKHYTTHYYYSQPQPEPEQQIPVPPVVQNYISFDPYQNNLGWTPPVSTSMPKNNNKSKYKKRKDRDRWKRKKHPYVHNAENTVWTGQELERLVQYLNKYYKQDINNDYDSDY